MLTKCYYSPLGGSGAHGTNDLRVVSFGGLVVSVAVKEDLTGLKLWEKVRPSPLD